MNIYCLERSSQGISTLTMDEFLTRGGGANNLKDEHDHNDDDDVSPFDNKYIWTAEAEEEGTGKQNNNTMTKSTSTRSIVSTTKKTTKTTTTFVSGQKVTTTVVVEDATPEELERMRLDKATNNTNDKKKEATESNNGDDSADEKRGRRRHRHSARAVMNGVMERITRSLSRGASAARRSLSRGSRGRGSSVRRRSSTTKKDKSSKNKKEKQKGKGQVYVREDGKKVRRVKKKDKNNPTQPCNVEIVPSRCQDGAERHHCEQEDPCNNHDLVCPDATQSFTTAPSVELEPPFIGPSPPSPEVTINSTDLTIPVVHHSTTVPETELKDDPTVSYVGPQPCCNGKQQQQQQQPSIPLQQEPEDVMVMGPMLPDDDWIKRAAQAAMTAKAAPPTQTVLNSVIKAEGTRWGTVPAWRLQATAAAKNRATVPPSIVQQSMDAANNPGAVPAWKKRAQAAAAAAAKKNHPATSTTAAATSSRPPDLVQQSIEQAANQGVPAWKPKAKASATAAVAKKLDERGGTASAATVPEWKQKLLEKKRQKLLELQQIKAEANAGGGGGGGATSS